MIQNGVTSKKVVTAVEANANLFRRKSGMPNRRCSRGECFWLTASKAVRLLPDTMAASVADTCTQSDAALPGRRLRRPARPVK